MVSAGALRLVVYLYIDKLDLSTPFLLGRWLCLSVFGKFAILIAIDLFFIIFFLLTLVIALPLSLLFSIL